MGSEYKLSSVYPQTKPFMDDNGRRKLQQKSLRVQALTQEAVKRHRLMTENELGAENLSAGQQPCTNDAVMAAQQQRPPDTDFSSFMQQLNKERHWGQQQHDQISSKLLCQHQQPQQQLPQKSPDMLTRILNQHSLQAAPSSVSEMQSMMSLDRTFPPDASRDGFIRAPAAAAGDTSNDQPAAAGVSAAASVSAGRQQWHLQQLKQIPWDWGVKSKVKLGSSAPFTVLQEICSSSLAPDCAAVSSGARCKDTAAMSNQERLAQSLKQWQHPASPLSSSMMNILRADREGATTLNSRVASWQQALRAAYAALRHGHCPVLYVVGQAFRQNFTAMFCSPGLVGYHGIHAVISRTNKQLRSYLASMGCYGVQAGSLDEQQQQQQQGPGSKKVASFDGQPGSQLLLAGQQQVHCLYAALFSLPWCSNDQPDVPLLSAPVQFMYAQLCPLQLQQLPDSVLDQQQQQQAAQQGGALQPWHYAELTGCQFIMPWTVHRLLQLLQDTQQDAGFEVWLESDAQHSSVNVLPCIWQQVEAACRKLGMPVAAAAKDEQQQQWRVKEEGFSRLEQQGWQDSAALLQGRVLRQIRLVQGCEEVAARLG